MTIITQLNSCQHTNRPIAQTSKTYCYDCVDSSELKSKRSHVVARVKNYLLFSLISLYHSSNQWLATGVLRRS